MDCKVILWHSDQWLSLSSLLSWNPLQLTFKLQNLWFPFSYLSSLFDPSFQLLVFALLLPVFSFGIFSLQQMPGKELVFLLPRYTATGAHVQEPSSSCWTHREFAPGQCGAHSDKQMRRGDRRVRSHWSEDKDWRSGLFVAQGRVIWPGANRGH